MTYVIIALHLFGLFTAVHAVMNTRVSQAAVAWAVSLVSFPYVSLPLYWLFGIYKERTSVDLKALRLKHVFAMLHQNRDYSTWVSSGGRSGAASPLAVFEKLAKMPVTGGNQVKLLIDGAATFAEIFTAIRAAKSYVLIEFFIINDDELGRQLLEILIDTVKRGVRVYVMYDVIGSRKITRDYLRDLRAGGVEVRAFRVREKVSRFQINFRNHRKIVVVDGVTALVGGHNVGDEYLGKSKRFGHWRDTHVRVDGPVVPFIQSLFVADWYVVTEEFLDLVWSAPVKADAQPATSCLVVGSDPLQGLDLAGLSFVQAINMATKRIWVTSPYFIPDYRVMTALKLKAIAGVDVRILLPDKMDHLLVYLAAFSYHDELTESGIKFYRYKDGFLHQKVFLIDDDICAVGTANLDPRSFHLNFELMLFSIGSALASEVATMLEADFAESRALQQSEYRQASFPFRAAVRISRLFSPVL